MSELFQAEKHPSCSLRLKFALDALPHLLHDLFVRNLWPLVGQAGHDFGLKPLGVLGFFLGRFKLGDQGVKFRAHVHILDTAQMIVKILKKTSMPLREMCS